MDARAARPGTAPQHALTTLREAILVGSLRPGEQVLQGNIAGRLGLSVAPIREALRVLEQEGQVTYRPRRGYFVTELKLEDLEEIYELRRLLEGRAARHALPALDHEAINRIELVAHDHAAAARASDMAAELQHCRRFHFAIFESPDRPHVTRLIRLLWDSTEAYRAMAYDSSKGAIAVDAHQRILGAIRTRDAEALVTELDQHRVRTFRVLRRILLRSDIVPVRGTERSAT